jgi:hypothetical protein
MSTEEPKPPLPQPPPPRWTWGAGALFALGVLITVPSGLCTGLFGFIALANNTNEYRIPILMVLQYGGVPLLLGCLLIWAGFRLRKRD